MNSGNGRRQQREVTTRGNNIKKIDTMKKENHLNKRDLARKMSLHGGMTIEMAEICLSCLVEIFRETMANDGEIVLQNMGSFSTCEMKKRLLYNPITGERMVVNARKRVKFTPSTTLNINGDDAEQETEPETE